jgi:hypothetical protein
MTNALTTEEALVLANKYIECQKKGAEARKRYMERNKDKINKKQRERYRTNPEKYRGMYNEYYKNNKEKKKAYYQVNKEQILAKKRIRDATVQV